jgi:hypothetical protein
MKKYAVGVIFVMLSAVSMRAQEPSTGFSVQLKMPLEAKTTTGAPYSAETVNDRTQVLSDGNRIVQHSTGRVYRDSEGRTRREEDRPSGQPGISITDPVAGVSWSLDPETRTAWKTAAFAGTVIMNNLDQAKLEAAKVKVAKQLESELQARRERERANTIGAGGPVVTIESGGGGLDVRRPKKELRNAEALPTKMLEGVRVEGKRVTTTLAAGAIGNERPIVSSTEEWTSPDLQVLVSSERKDPREGDSSYRLVNIILGEPPASMFQVPTDYTIRETGIRRFEER